MLLGRRLLAPAAAGKNAAQRAEDVTETADAALLRRAEADDRFFCDTMENIPAQFYFPTDEEENWRKSAPKAAKKYHKVRKLRCCLTE